MAEKFDLPVPPMTRRETSLIKPGVAASLYMPSGKKIEGSLVGFDTDKGTIHLIAKGAQQAVRFGMTEIKALQINIPAPWILDPELGKGNNKAITPPSPWQKFSIVFTDGSTLEGETFGSRVDNYGLHIFKKCGEEQYLHIFVAKTAIEKQNLGDQLGEILVDQAGVSKEAVEKAVAEQAEAREKPLGDYLVSHKVVNAKQLEEALQRQKSMPQMRLGEILTSENMITEQQLEEALEEQKSKRKMPLGEILVAKGLVNRAEIQQALAKKVGIPFVRIQEFQILPATIQLVPEELVFEHKVIPLYEFSNKLAVAMENPLDFRVLDELRFHTNKYIEPVMATAEDIDAAIQMYYATNTDVFDDIEEEDESDEFDESNISNTDVELADNIVVKLINKIILDAHQQGVSDIHIEPYPGKAKTVVRFRKDGTLIKYHEFPAHYRASLISRIKIMAKLDISERRKPQDGKIAFKQFGPANIELRVATIPTTGDTEDVVMRILASNKAIPITQIGLSDHNLDPLLDAISKPYGLFLVCGPTGSGKTTTLHSILGHLNNTERKIWTAEDPVEITQRGLRQVQVNPKVGVTFASAMRAFLRADPDIIMVGEMRDEETAAMGVEASLTGHLVLSTLHTNSAVESVSRLLDMGMDPFNFADALVGVLAQRLAKSLCSNCKQAYRPEDEEIERLAHDFCIEQLQQMEDEEEKAALIANQIARWKEKYGKVGDQFTLYKPVGCDICSDTGYSGRIGLHELLIASDEIKHLIVERATISTIQTLAQQEGLRTLKQDGIEKVLQGQTDYPQIRRVCIK